MCLKFLLESNPENQALVSSLEAREVAQPDSKTKETLSNMGVELVLGEDGKPKILREKGAGWYERRERERRRGGAGRAKRGVSEEVVELLGDGDDNEELGLENDELEGELKQDQDKGKGKEADVDEDGQDDDIEFM